jgi:hypothetical protein
MKERGLKGSRKSIFIGGTNTHQREEGEMLLYHSKKVVVGMYPVEIETSGF